MIYFLLLVAVLFKESYSLSTPVRPALQRKIEVPSETPVQPIDLILSSGFCAFARQAGVIAAVSDFSIPIDRVVGTSSGALAAALFADGYDSFEIATELKRRRPIQLLQPSIRLNRGLFSLNGLVAHLRTLLPNDFSQLEKPLAVGVFETESGIFRLISDGDLPSAVAASCAIPYIFQAVKAGNPPVFMADGGFKDRLGISAWADWSGASSQSPRRAIVNLVGTPATNAEPIMTREQTYHEFLLPNPLAQSSKKETIAECLLSPSKERHIIVPPADTSLFVVRTPKADASLLSLKDFENQRLVAYALAAKGLTSPEFKSFISQE